MKLVQYDFHPSEDNVLFYIELYMYIEMHNMRTVNTMSGYEALQKKRVVFLNCIKIQLSALMKYGKLNIHRENCLQYPDMIELNIKNEIKIIVDNLKVAFSNEPINLQTTTLNKIRGSLVVLTVNQISKLNIPDHLKIKFATKL